MLVQIKEEEQEEGISLTLNFSVCQGRRARILIGVAWLLSFLFATPALFIFYEKAVDTGTGGNIIMLLSSTFTPPHFVSRMVEESL